MQKKYRLTRPVTLEGKDFWGFESKIKFSPMDNGYKGFYWRYSPARPSLPIIYKHVQAKRRRIGLQSVDRIARLECYEHLGFLRWMGLDGVTIECDSFHGWPPMFTVKECWDRLQQECKEIDEPWEWVTIPKLIQVSGTESIGMQGKFPNLVIKPKHTPGLELNINICYSFLGERAIHLNVPEDITQNMLSTLTPGLPYSLYYISKLCGMLGWPSHKKIMWPQGHQVEYVLDQFIWHRVIDILGDFSLAHESALLAVSVESYCGGHLLDMVCLQKMPTQLVRVSVPRAAANTS
jgi:UDP-3-O-acyl-N-acetylglucosamine deacetylase